MRSLLVVQLSIGRSSSLQILLLHHFDNGQLGRRQLLFLIVIPVAIASRHADDIVSLYILESRTYTTDR
jgi:hypothetical protein